MSISHGPLERRCARRTPRRTDGRRGAKASVVGITGLLVLLLVLSLFALNGALPSHLTPTATRSTASGLTGPLPGYLSPSSAVGPTARAVAAPQYTVTFREVGVPPPFVPTPIWSVTLNGVQQTAESASIIFNEPNGTYAFTAGAPQYVAHPASGKVDVAGAAVTLTISFTPFAPTTYNLTFVESGLSPGTNWSVAVGSALNYSTGTSKTFALTNGTYGFTVQSSNGWIATPSNGTVRINGSDVREAVNFSAPSPPPPPPVGFLGLPGLTGYYLIGAVGGGIAVAGWYSRRLLLQRRAKATAVVLPKPAGRPSGTVSGERAGAAPVSGRRGTSPFLRYALMRLALIPGQLVFLLWILYLAIVVPPELSTLTTAGFFTGFGSMVANIFTGNWGPSNTVFSLPWFTLYVDFLPTSLQIALFALPLSAVFAYFLALGVGWNRRTVVDLPARISTLALGLIPVFIVALLVESALFFAYVNAFQSIPGNGIIPSPDWFETYGGGIPPWVIDGWITRPTGVPIIDGLIHQAWTFELITIVKTLIQGIAVAIVYVAVFLRHGRAIVAAASAEPHITAARSRGIPEGTLLWTHTARRVIPSFLILFALTIPAYLVTQFVVECVFQDPGIGNLTITLLTSGGSLTALEGMIFLLAVFVLAFAYLADLFAARADPRGAVAR